MSNKDKEERRRHSTSFIPYSYYECRIPQYFGNVPMHWHGEFEINYIVSGRGTFICGNDRFLAGEGDILVLPPNMLHAAYPDQGGELVYQALVFHPVMLGAGTNDRCTTECIRPLMNGTMKVQVLISADAGKCDQHTEACAGNDTGDSYGQMREAVEQIFACVTGEKPLPDLLLKSELMRLFWLLETQEAYLRREDTGIDYCEAIRPALEYMVKNFREDITVAQLAGLAHLSESYFMNCFKKAVGVSAIGYLIQLRMNAACEALACTKEQISEIALACGYENLSNFNRQFKKTAGCSPKEYRKQSARQWSGDFRTLRRHSFDREQ